MSSHTYKKDLWFRVAFAIGVVVGIGAFTLAGLGWATSITLGWIGTALVLVGSILLSLKSYDSSATARLVKEENFGNETIDTVVLIASIASVIAVAVMIATGGSNPWNLGLALITLTLSWAVIHSIYVMKYATLYYHGKKGGIDFNNRDKSDPAFADFAYVSFNIGIAFQAGDPVFTDRSLRIAALKHGIISFVFNTVIIAAAVSIIVALK